MDDENIYDEVQIEDMDFDPDYQIFTAPCPCGDKFQITLSQLQSGYAIAECPSCSLQVRVIFDSDILEQFQAQVQEVQAF